MDAMDAAWVDASVEHAAPDLSVAAEDLAAVDLAVEDLAMVVPDLAGPDLVAFAGGQTTCAHDQFCCASYSAPALNADGGAIDAGSPYCDPSCAARYTADQAVPDAGTRPGVQARVCAVDEDCLGYKGILRVGCIVGVCSYTDNATPFERCCPSPEPGVKTCAPFAVLKNFAGYAIPCP